MFRLLISLGGDGRSHAGFFDRVKPPLLRSLSKEDAELGITEEDVAMHNKIGDAWIVLGGQVFDITSYAKFHPGGLESIMQSAGKDGLEFFSTLLTLFARACPLIP